ncbi:MAG: hypothetical protein JNL50_05735 [Phycisphaerae bacterium]|nr:hypothetical protein [Phycisphaerae bacterium]MCC6230945.1 hypothetical protein [Phycisphaerales bacterium]
MSNAEYKPEPATTPKRSRDLDDRGKPITPLSLPDLVKESVAADDRAARQRLATWLGRAARHSKPLRSTDLLRPVPLLLTAMFFGSCMLTSTLESVIGAAAFLLPWVVLFLAFYVEKRVLPRRVLRSAPSLVAEGFCGQCGYSLRELPVQSDACIVCSECGAAWNKDRVTWPWWNHAEPHWSRVGHIFSKPESARAGRDSLGRIVSIRTLQDLADLQRDAEGERKTAIADADRALSRTSRWKRAAAAIFATLAFGAIGAVLLASLLEEMRANNAWQAFICPSILWIVGIIFAIGILGGSMFTPQRDVARALAARGVCPSCTALWPPEERRADRVVCSACGSTWGLAPNDSR